ncbi:hypothetical protein ACFVMC_08760 [Nocardia sp. NPDC127579]|uniref:hypothetical protein n=1 Tax=Nocardia sp. NPDC127579 TaxID=3345402 RepID=UPI00362558CF
MTLQPNAIGFLNTAISGVHLEADQEAIRELARVQGFDFCGFIIHEPGRTPVGEAGRQLRKLRADLDAQAIYVPSLGHLVAELVPGEFQAEYVRAMNSTEPEDDSSIVSNRSSEQRKVDAVIRQWKVNRSAGQSISNHTKDT